MLAALSAATTVLFVLSGGVVGIRLILLARRTGGFAEWMLGPGLLLITGIGYPALIVGNGLAERESDAGRLVLLIAMLLMSIGWALVWTFTWRVFRPESRWAIGLVWLAYATLVVCLGQSTVLAFTVASPSELRVPGWGAIGVQVNAVALYLWTALEAFRYHGLLKKRIALGLTTATVVNRFFLWGLVAVFSALSMAAPLSAALRGLDFMDHPFLLLCVSVGGAATALTLYLAFLPPKAYLARLEARGRQTHG